MSSHDHSFVFSRCTRPSVGLSKLIATPTWGSASTWVTLRSQFSLINCFSLPCIPRSPLFPTAAIVNALRFTASGSNRCSQTFNWSDDRQLIQGFSCGSFTSYLCNHLAPLGFDPKLFAGHSLRRGGASFAYQRGVPIELFKALGEWHSDTILIYLTMPLTGRLHSAYMLCKAILRHNPLHPHTN